MNDYGCEFYDESDGCVRRENVWWTCPICSRRVARDEVDGALVSGAVRVECPECGTLAEMEWRLFEDDRPADVRLSPELDEFIARNRDRLPQFAAPGEAEPDPAVPGWPTYSRAWAIPPDPIEIGTWFPSRFRPVELGGRRFWHDGKLIFREDLFSVGRDLPLGPFGEDKFFQVLRCAPLVVEPLLRFPVISRQSPLGLRGEAVLFGDAAGRTICMTPAADVDLFCSRRPDCGFVVSGADRRFVAVFGRDEDFLGAIGVFGILEGERWT